MTTKERLESLLNRANNTVSDIDFNNDTEVIDRLEWALDNTLNELEQYKEVFGEINNID